MRNLLCFALTLLIALAAHADPYANFAAKTYADKDGKELLYRQQDPVAIEAGKKYPLVLFLHGAGGRGDDNVGQLRDAGMVGMLAKQGFRENFPCYFVAPQVPKGKRWVEVHWGLDAHGMPETPGDQLRMALEVVDGMLKSHPIDSSRVYVTGLSMGGFGTWDALQRRPELFAAAYPVCGGADIALAARMAKIPLWIWHGDSDTTVKTKRSRDIVAALKAAGGSPTYTEVPKRGHNSWTDAYGHSRGWEWLFAQAKGRAEVRPAVSAEKIRVACVGDSITFGAGIKDRKNMAYPVQLGTLLGDGYEVRNYGVSARTMLRKGDHPIQKEPAYAKALAFLPNVVVIKLGTNDTKPHNWKHKADFAEDTRAMVAEFRALPSKPTVYLCRPVPAYPERWGISDVVIKNEVIPLIDAVGKELGVTIIDLYTALSDKPKMFPDKIHPNAAGAGLIAQEIHRALKAK
ncbi:MAG: lysophospholipase L1-like esterase/predicted esterase [Rhodothermales bacterium]|jgi:lysophospholipase L1-like esterase/predicted esterase